MLKFSYSFSFCRAICLLISSLNCISFYFSYWMLLTLVSLDLILSANAYLSSSFDCRISYLRYAFSVYICSSCSFFCFICSSCYIYLSLIFRSYEVILSCSYCHLVFSISLLLYMTMSLLCFSIFSSSAFLSLSSCCFDILMLSILCSAISMLSYILCYLSCSCFLDSSYIISSLCCFNRAFS